MKSIWELSVNDMISPAVQKVQGVVKRSFAQIESYQAGFEKKASAIGNIFKIQQVAASKFGGALSSVLGGGVGGTIQSLGMSILKVGSNMEQTRTSFGVLLGSTDAATKKIAELEKFADFSPFNSQEVFDAGQKLLGFKVSQEKLLPVMNMLGDVSQGQGDKFNSLVDNYGKMVTAQRANTEDLNQFATAGVPIWDELGKVMGKNGEALRKHVETNGVGIDQIDKALSNLTSSGGMFHGMMQKQSETTAGRWSTLTSQFEKFGIKIFDAIQPFLNKMMDLATKAMPVIEKVLNGIMDAVKRISDAVGPAIPQFKEAFGKIWDSAVKIFGKLKPVIAEMSDVILPAIVTAFGFVLDTIAVVMDYIATHQWVIDAISFAFKAVGYAIFWPVIALQKLLQVFEQAMPAMAGFAAAVKTMFAEVGTFISKALSGSAKLVTGIFTGDIDMIKEALSELGNSGSALMDMPSAMSASYDKAANEVIAQQQRKAEAGKIVANGELVAGAAGPLPADSQVGTPFSVLQPLPPKTDGKTTNGTGSVTGGGNNTGSPSTGGGGGTGGGKNIIINIQNLVGEVKFIGDLKTNIPNAKAQLKEALLSVVNDTELSAG